MIAGITQIVSDKGLEWALAKRVSQKAKEVNERALQLGLELGKRMAEGKHED
jgi:hypothetical protein